MERRDFLRWVMGASAVGAAGLLVPEAAKSYFFLKSNPLAAQAGVYSDYVNFSDLAISEHLDPIWYDPKVLDVIRHSLKLGATPRPKWDDMRVSRTA